MLRNSKSNINLNLYIRALAGFFVGGLFFFLVGTSAYPSIEKYVAMLAAGNIIVSTNGIDIFSIILFTFPLIIQMGLFSSLIYEDIDRSAVFLFTRSKSMRTWLLGKMAVITTASMFFFLNMELAIIALGYLYNIPVIGFNLLIRTAAAAFILTGLCQTVFLLACSLFALHFEIKGTVIVTLCVYLMSALLTAVGIMTDQNWLCVILPGQQGIVNTHNITFIQNNIGYDYDNTISFFTLKISVIYNVVLLALIYIYGLVSIKKYDVL